MNWAHAMSCAIGPFSLFRGEEDAAEGERRRGEEEDRAVARLGSGKPR